MRRDVRVDKKYLACEAGVTKTADSARFSVDQNPGVKKNVRNVPRKPFMTERGKEHTQVKPSTVRGRNSFRHSTQSESQLVRKLANRKEEGTFVSSTEGRPIAIEKGNGS